MSNDNQSTLNTHETDQERLPLATLQNISATKTNLAIRLEQVLTLVNDLAARKIKYSLLDRTQLATLIDAFQRADGTLDIKRLMLTVFDTKHSMLWTEQIYQLLQQQDIHHQLSNLTVQSALQQSKYWNESQVEAIIGLQKIGTKKSIFGVPIETRLALQGLYMNNKMFNTLPDSTALCLAWLNAHTQGEVSANNFFHGLETHLAINEKKVMGALSHLEVKQADQFRYLFERLKDAAFVSNVDIATQYNAGLFSGQPGYYLLQGKYHALILVREQNREGQHTLSLYDPNVGMMHMSDGNTDKNGTALRAALHEYLQGKNNLADSQTRAEHYGIKQQEGQYQFHIYKVNLDRARESIPALHELQTLLSDFRTESQRMAETPVTFGQITLTVRLLREMGATLGGVPLALTHITDTNLATKLLFDPSQLNDYLTYVDSDNVLAKDSIKLLKQQITARGGSHQLLRTDVEQNATTSALRLLDKIHRHVRDNKISDELWSSLHIDRSGYRHFRNIKSSFTDISNLIGMGIKGYCYLSEIYNLMKYNQMLKHKDLADELRAELILNRNLAIGSVSTSVGIDVSQYVLAKLNGYIARIRFITGVDVTQQQLSQLAQPPTRFAGVGRTLKLEKLGSRVSTISLNAGTKLVKFGGPVLNVLSTGFDIYDAYRSFSQLATITDVNVRQDLVFRGLLSSISAAVGIGIAIVFATGAVAATIAGPIGVVAGLGLMATGRIYSAIRQIEEVEKYITLSDSQKFENGWRIFFGGSLTPDLRQKVVEKKQLPLVRMLYDQQLFAHAAKTVLTTADVDTYYYSRGFCELVPHYYLDSTPANTNSNRHTRATKPVHKNVPAENLQTPYEKFPTQYKDWSTKMELGSLLYSKPTGLYGINDVVNANEYSDALAKAAADAEAKANGYANAMAQAEALGQDKAELLFLAAHAKDDSGNHHDAVAKAHTDMPYSTFIPPSHTNVRRFKQTTTDSENTSAIFDLGDGFDTAFGHRNKRNIFEGGAGTKFYTGGQLSDVFFLTGAAKPIVPSHFNGGDSLDFRQNGDALSSAKLAGLEDNNDILIAKAKPQEGNGYAIDLEAGTIHYVGLYYFDFLTRKIRYKGVEGVVAKISNIEHVSGHRGSDDFLAGNHLNNRLNGQGGLDRLYGYAGEDILTLEAGYMYGGSGLDTYCILQNSQPGNVQIYLNDSRDRENAEEKISNIMLNHDVTQIESIKLIPLDEILTYGAEIKLRNDNGTETILLLEDVYQIATDNNKRLELVSQYILSTRDGFLLFPQWAENLEQNDDGSWPLSPTFRAQYSPVHDQNKKDFFNDPLTEEKVINLQQNNAQKQGQVTVNGIQTRLPEFIHLIQEDTLFNDHMEGDQSHNTLHSRRGNDTLRGKAGSDIYHIYHEQAGSHRKIGIDNHDPEENPWLDLLVFDSISIDKLNQVKQDRNDIVLSSLSSDVNSGFPIGSIEVRIRDFMLNAHYRHIAVIDSLGDVYHLDIDDQNRPYLGQKESETQATAGDDCIVLSRAVAIENNTFDALAGNDTIIDTSGLNRTLCGGAGNDMLLAIKGGKKVFEGGTGDDLLEGGEEDDTYRYTRGDGQDTIRDLGGSNTLLLLGNITKKDLQLQRKGDNMEVIIGAKNADDAGLITIENQFESSVNQIEKIRIGEETYNMNRLMQLMSLFHHVEQSRVTENRGNHFSLQENYHHPVAFTQLFV